MKQKKNQIDLQIILTFVRSLDKIMLDWCIRKHVEIDYKLNLRFNDGCISEYI